MENIGCDIMLNASGSRDTTEVATYFDKGQSENIPIQFQKKTYKKQTVVFGYLLVYSCIRLIKMLP